MNSDFGRQRRGINTIWVQKNHDKLTDDSENFPVFFFNVSIYNNVRLLKKKLQIKAESLPLSASIINLDYIQSGELDLYVNSKHDLETNPKTNMVDS